MKNRIRALFEGFPGPVALDVAAIGGYLGLSLQQRRALQLALRELGPNGEKWLEISEKKGLPWRYSQTGRVPGNSFGPLSDPPARKSDQKGGFVEVEQNNVEEKADDKRYRAPAYCRECGKRWSPLMRESDPAMIRLRQFAAHGSLCPMLPSRDPVFWIEGLDWIFYGPRGETKSGPQPGFSLRANVPIEGGGKLEHAQLWIAKPGEKGKPNPRGTVAFHFAGDNPFMKPKGPAAGNEGRGETGSGATRKRVRRKG
jgi:hypothetical protein